MTTTEQVNQTIITALQGGKVPWRSDHGFPKNILTRRRFSGIDAILLMLATDHHGFTSCFWGTRLEWEALGGKVKEGSVTNLPLGEVFNLNQVSGSFPVSRHEVRIFDSQHVERIVANTKADIRYTDEPVAEYYFPRRSGGDYIKMCRKEHFLCGAGIGAYYHALLHEVTHFTECRLKWDSPQDLREMRAEIGADFLTTELAVPNYPYKARTNVQNHIGRWVKRMKKDPTMIFDVADGATSAADFILGFTGKVEARHLAA